MKSKGFVRFLNRIATFNADNEIIDIVLQNKELMKSDDALFINLDPAKHQTLAKRKNTSENRTKAIQHLRQSLYCGYIKDLYEETTEYFRYILKNYSSQLDKDTKRLLGEHNFKCNANEILSLSTYEEIVAFIVNNVFQQLENERSTPELIKKINSKLGLGIEEANYQNAIPYLLSRHYLIHSDGKIPKEIQEQYPVIKVDQKGYIILNLHFIKEACTNVTNLICLFDEKMTEKNYFKKSEYNPLDLKK